jgi:hypothetical protein
LIKFAKTLDNGLFPKIHKRSLLKAAEKLSQSNRANYVLSGAIAAHLSSCSSADENLSRLLELVEHVSGDSKAANLCVGAIDLFVCDIFKSTDITDALTDDQADLGTTLVAMTEMFLGRLHTSPQKAAAKGLVLLSKHFEAEVQSRSMSKNIGRNPQHEAAKPRIHG